MILIKPLWMLVSAAALTYAFPLHSSPASAPALSRRAIWQPSVGASWQIVLSKTLNINAASPSITPDVDVLDIDMFLHVGNPAVPALHKLNKKVICYFSAGTYESYRPDSVKFPREVMGKELAEWPGEFWIDVRRQAVRDIMAARIQIAAQIGCDAIDPDNVDAYDNDNGLNLTKADLADFVRFLAAEAAKYNMAMGLKNALDIVPDVLPVIQFAVNEQCAELNECGRYESLIAAQKPVFHIEYTDLNPAEALSVPQVSRVVTTVGGIIQKPCIAMNNIKNFSTVIKTFALDGAVTYCDGQTYSTNTQ